MRQALAHYPYMTLTMIGLFVFLGIFAAIVAWTLLPANQAKYRYSANLPLDLEAEEQP